MVKNDRYHVCKGTIKTITILCLGHPKFFTELIANVSTY